MRKIILLLTIALLAILVYSHVTRRPNLILNRSKKAKIKVSLSPEIKSIFVPYWSLDEGLVSSNYDRYFYFGITADSQGVERQEVGFQKLNSFVKLTEGKNSYLVLRLLDDDFNKRLLADKNLQRKIIEETIEVEKENNFKGLAIDLEIFNLFSNEVINQTNNFVKDFYTRQKQNYKPLAVILYGDIFFRKRPFDLFFLSKYSDEILVMAYDFHKSRGEAGPNFPYDLGPNNNYSFKKMVSDFVSVVAKEKLTIIVGMFGYDWMVDEKKRPIAPAKALTLKQIKNKFSLDSLDTQQVSSQAAIKRDDISKETEIDYTVSATIPDEQGIYRIDYHVIWFEDEESAKIKTEYLQKQGIGSIGYWAWGYF